MKLEEFNIEDTAFRYYFARKIYNRKKKPENVISKSIDDLVVYATNPLSTLPDLMVLAGSKPGEYGKTMREIIDRNSHIENCLMKYLTFLHLKLKKPKNGDFFNSNAGVYIVTTCGKLYDEAIEMRKSFDKRYKYKKNVVVFIPEIGPEQSIYYTNVLPYMETPRLQ